MRSAGGPRSDHLVPVFPRIPARSRLNSCNHVDFLRLRSGFEPEGRGAEIEHVKYDDAFWQWIEKVEKPHMLDFLPPVAGWIPSLPVSCRNAAGARATGRCGAVGQRRGGDGLRTRRSPSSSERPSRAQASWVAPAGSGTISVPGLDAMARASVPVALPTNSPCVNTGRTIAVPGMPLMSD